ncbi:phytanoyl-CoA dioxygenase family protein [Brevundimonas sp. LjRoot202]|uniref:phytanoyl-CoA dioxygenase family protein n=1 Tax=Brevundimonas sp. LjRoot202 TaxID=3342281 RepID=UPI003ED0B048
MGAAGEDDLAGVMDREAFERDGVLHAGGPLAESEVDLLRALADERIGSRPGARLEGEPVLVALLAANGPIGAVAMELTSATARPVRAVLFDKTADGNWSVAWHQDRTIPVRERAEVDGFGPWSMKDGVPHVAPPPDVLARMITLRIHLDDVDADNAPLRVARGSHRLGRVPAAEAALLAESRPQTVCLARTGDVWAYKTLILHTSAPSRQAMRRRVLQVDYADFDLPPELNWRPIG